MKKAQIGLITLIACLGLTSCNSGSQTANAPAVNSNAVTAIQAISVTPMTQPNACRSVIGGLGIWNPVTVSHSKVEGAPITLQLYDRFKLGGGYDHKQLTKPSSVTGTTVFSATELLGAGLIPPCHTRMNPEAVSNYFWIASSGSSQKELLWGRMTMATVK